MRELVHDLLLRGDGGESEDGVRPRVCIGFAEALSAPEVAWSLEDAGFEVVAIGRKGRRSALRHSRRISVLEVTAPERDATAALAELTRLFEVEGLPKSGRGAILPLDDAAVWLFSQLDPGSEWVVAGPRGAAAEVALRKEVQVQAARDAGLRVPRTTIARTACDVRSRADELPLILRSADAVLVREGRLRNGRTWICSTRAELEDMIMSWAEGWPLMVQPFIRGIGEGVFGVATDRGVRGWSAHRRLRMMNPHGSGSSACVSQPVPTELQPSIERFIQESGWRGLFMVELLRDQSGALWFVEFNGRTWGSMALARRRGLEYPAWAVKQALDPATQIVGDPGHDRQVVCRNAGRELLHLGHVLRGPRSAALADWPGFWRSAMRILAVRRGEYFYNWRRDDLGVFFSDFWYTLAANIWKSRN
jgi:predicted ATP-grasp superfamily ATP-dependent carboligase